MLLGANGQNIYPEEIEDKLNSMTLVVESLIVQNGDKLVALIYPDYDEANSLGLSKDDLQQIMQQNLIELNQAIPSFSRISTFKLQDEEFEKRLRKVSNDICIRTLNYNNTGIVKKGLGNSLFFVSNLTPEYNKYKDNIILVKISLT